MDEKNKIGGIEKEELKNIEIRSEEFQEVLGAPPHWLLRAGIQVILLVVVVILIGSWFFKYPDIIVSQVSILTENPPVALKSYTTGKITHLFYAENQEIKKDSVIAIIENTANHQDVLYLQSITDTLCNFHYFPDSLILRLGELQQNYSNLLRLLKSYNNFISLDYYNQKIQSLKKQTQDYNKYYSSLVNQLEIMTKELEISEKLFKRDENLYSQGVHAKADYEKAEQSYLQQKRNYESSKNTLTNTEMQINQLGQQILDLQLQKTQEQNNYEVQIHESLETLKSQILKWEQSYLIKSPIDGRVTFTEFWSKNQTVQSGNIVSTIIPENETKIIGKAIIPSTGIGKVKVGQNVNIKLENFPHMEFGMLRAKVKNISLVPVESEKGIFYTAELELSSEFVSNYGKELRFSQNMVGSAEIITDDVRLLERFLNPLRSIWKKSIE